MPHARLLPFSAPRVSRIAALATGILVTSGLQAFGCDVGYSAYRLDWNDVSWSSGSLSGTITAREVSGSGTLDIDISFTGRTSAFDTGYPEVSSFINGGYGSTQDALQAVVDFSYYTHAVTLEIDFPEAVEDLHFTVLDLDYLRYTSYETGGFRDVIEVVATGGGATPEPEFSTPYYSPPQSQVLPSTVYLGDPVADNQAVGNYGNADNDEDHGNVLVDFNAPVEHVEIEYSNKIYRTSTNPQRQGIAFYDMEFCLPAPTEVQAQKTLTLLSETGEGCDILPGIPDPEAQHMLPGACIAYRISAQNVGSQVADQMIISDTLPDDMIFIAAVQSGFSSGGTGFGLETPPPETDCGGASCVISLQEARLDPGQSGEILIHALVK